MQRKILSGAIEKYATGLTERQIRVIASTATKDRVGDIMIAEGCDLSSYRSNPIVLFNHDPKTPVGNADIEIRMGRVEALVTFAPTGASEEADEVCALTKGGVLRAVSVGFVSISSEPIRGGGRKISAWSLLELSIVSVPANPDAQVIARSLSGETDSEADRRAYVEREEWLDRQRYLDHEEKFSRFLSLQRPVASHLRATTKAQRTAEIERLRRG